MLKRYFLIAVLLLLTFVSLYAVGDTEKASSGSSIDWFELLIVVGYLVGVFILLPLIIYTNLKGKLFEPASGNQDEIQIIEGLSEEERNNRAALILEAVEEQLTSFQSEDGENMVTIANGKQAKFMRNGLNYINKKLSPTNQDLISRVNEFAGVYEDRTRRAFTGSNWIILCSLAVGVLFILSAGGLKTFIFLHFFGLLFYILSSRTTFYGIQKRMELFGGGSNFVSSIMSALFLGKATKYYIKESGHSWKRDWETEGQMAIFGLIFLIVVAMILGFFAAFLGVINFVINYSTSFILPFKAREDWFEKEINQI